MNSIWWNSCSLPEFRELDGSISTDVLIIGGGIAGILTAYRLKKSGVECIIAEAERICSGVTANTTAKITAQHGLIYNRLINEFGTEKARMYFEINTAAINEYRLLAENIDCDFKVTANFVYSKNNRRKIEKELDAFEKIGLKAEFCDTLPLPFPIAGAVKLSDQAEFNPLKLLSGIAKNLNIYENTRVKELRGLTAVTDKGEIHAKKIIVATHFPFLNKHGSYFFKMYQQRSYVAAFENAKPLNGMYIDEDKNGFSFRNYENCILIGSGSKRTGKPCEGWQGVRDFAHKYYPAAKEKYAWATQDCITLDGVPYIGSYSANTENLFVATGFNKWGMTSSMAASMLLSDIVTGKENRYAELFSPSRTILRKQTAFNAAESAAELLSFTAKRCPHLGCALKWNPHEHSWDCPCHGSRFDENGRLLDNPAEKDMKIK